MPTYPVTGSLTDLGLQSLAPFGPVLIFMPPDLMPLSSGHLVAGPVEVTPAPNGYFTAPLAATADALTRDAKWRLKVGLRNPDGYAPGSGYFDWKTATWEFTVPRGGGRLVDCISARVADDVTAVALLTQRVGEELFERGIRWVFNLSTTPASLYRLEA